jgi:hypothetical protein
MRPGFTWPWALLLKKYRRSSTKPSVKSEFSYPAAVPHIHVVRHVVSVRPLSSGASRAAAVAGQRSGLDLGLRLAIMSGELYTALTGLRHALGLPPPNPYPLPRPVDRLCPICIAEVYDVLHSTALPARIPPSLHRQATPVKQSSRALNPRSPVYGDDVLSPV